MGFFFNKSADCFDREGQSVSGSMSVKQARNGYGSQFDRGAEAEQDGYDGGTMSDVFENYEDVRRGKGYAPVHFVATRKYLQQVRDQKRHIQLLENRIKYRKDAGLDTSWHEEDLVQPQKELKLTIAEVAEEISKLDDINQEVVMTKRYIEVMSWDDVAETADLKMRTVQKCHGRALPRMEEILLADGLIELDDADNSEDDED